jgi:hypothetical protein
LKNIWGGTVFLLTARPGLLVISKVTNFPSQFASSVTFAPLAVRLVKPSMEAYPFRIKDAGLRDC